ncbi:glycosyltransferase family 39 protein [Candidatus Microgenomates bacterium]|nr:glycosyltransferase family 39 protein [Candidatus Microgenomates bacterium]
MPNQFTASLWGDEAFAAVLSQKSLWEIVTILTRDTSPPAWYFFEHWWITIFGTSEIAIRSLSFTFFLLGVFFTYKIGARVWDRRTGLFAALLTFLNPFLFIYAFEGRMYSIMVGFVAASMYFFIARNWIPYVIATIIAIYSHHFALFAVAVQGLWFFKELLFGNRKLAFSIFKALFVVGLLYVPWLYPLYLQTTLVGGGFWLGVPTLEEYGGLIRKFLAEGIPHSLATPTLYVLYVVLALRRWTKDKEITLFLLLWFLLPITLTYIISQFFQSIFYDRYMLYVIPGATLLLASNRRIFSGFLILLACGMLFTINAFYFTHPTKRPFQDLSTYVKQTRKEGDILINHNAAAHHIWESKYYGIPAPLWVPEGDLPFYVGTALMTKDDIIRTIPQASRVGVITSGNIEDVQLPRYTKRETKVFGSLTFAWYENTQKSR